LAHFVRLSLPYGVSGFIWAIYFNFDALMLSLIRTESEVGLYAGVFRIVAISYIVGYALANTFTPLLFNAFHNNRSSYVHHARLLGASVSVLAVGVASVLFIFAEQLIDLLLGPAYLEAADVMRVLSAAAFFRIVNAGLCELLTTSNQQRKRVNWEFALLLANIVLNAILIPRWGGIGAAIATLSAEAVLLAGIAWVCYQSNLFTTAMATEAR
jgi:PST family polysaccharide transporter